MVHRFTEFEPSLMICGARASEGARGNRQLKRVTCRKCRTTLLTVKFSAGRYQ